jgi:hypothetical protein
MRTEEARKTEQCYGSNLRKGKQGWGSGFTSIRIRFRIQPFIAHSGYGSRFKKSNNPDRMRIRILNRTLEENLFLKTKIKSQK